jgi:hypothetical protein
MSSLLASITSEAFTLRILLKRPFLQKRDLRRGERITLVSRDAPFRDRIVWRRENRIRIWRKQVIEPVAIKIREHIARKPRRRRRYRRSDMLEPRTCFCVLKSILGFARAVRTAFLRRHEPRSTRRFALLVAEFVSAYEVVTDARLYFIEAQTALKRIPRGINRPHVVGVFRAVYERNRARPLLAVESRVSNFVECIF